MKSPAPPSADTIAAVATAPGRGGIGIVRVSGPAVREITGQLVGGLPEARRAELKTFSGDDGTELDTGIVLFFPAPHSFTGEDVLELHAHGGRVIPALLLQRVCELGARLARPGEFSERAFLNDKLDLAQAEAIADLVDSASVQAARAALRSLRGEFSARVRALVAALIELRSYVEAAIDFSDEELDWLEAGQAADRLRALGAQLDALQTAAAQGSVLREGLTVVIAGRPNAGKSSLLNRLAGYDAAIVTAIPGTTRDLLHEQITLDGLPLHVVDTAGLRDSPDAVEQEGVRRAWEALRSADRVLLVVDAAVGRAQEDQDIWDRLAPNLPVTVVSNKIDLTGRQPQVSEHAGVIQVALSAKTGVGLGLLVDHLKQLAGYQTEGEGVFLARRRHLQALQQTHVHLDDAQQRLAEHSGELLAEELRLAQRSLGEITGEFTSEDLLGEIFSNFCIGK